MAVTALGTALTSRHRLQQLQLRSATVRDLLLLFRRFDPLELSKSWSAIEPALVALIQARHPISAGLAGRYLAEFRNAEQVAGTASVVLAPSLTAEELIPNLRVVGIANAWRLKDMNRAPGEIVKTTITNVEGEVTRQTLAGGRSTLVDTVRADPKARGYTRVTDGNPCHFCAMLAGRGPVYNSDASSSFDAHRKCGCTGEPVYFTDSPWPDEAYKWKALYDESAKAVRAAGTSDFSGDVRREFRRRHAALTA